MKTTLLLLIGLTFSGVSFTQLTCDASAIQGSFGIWPEEFDDATANVPYSQQLNFKAPTNTADIPGAPVTATINTFKIVSVTGLPSGFTYSCNMPNCEGYIGGDSGCAELVGTATTSQVGSYNITIVISANVTIPLFGSQDMSQTFSNFTFVVQSDQTGDCGISIETGKTPLCVDSTLQLKANTEGGVWGVTGAGVEVSQTGLVKGISAGNAIITYGGGTSMCAEEGNYLVVVQKCTAPSDPPGGEPNPPGGNPNPNPTPPDTTSAINDLAISQAVLYPNPTTDFVTIENSTDVVSYTIFDMNGRKIVEEKVQNTQNIIDVQFLNSGIYFVKLNELNGASVTHKLIKRD